MNTDVSKSGRKPEVTVEQVIEASEILMQQNRKVTGWTLREVIGSGGPNYLLRVWEQYQLDNGVDSTTDEITVVDHVLPPELEEKIHILIGDISHQINTFAVESDNLANRVAQKKAHAAYDTLMSTNKQLVDEQELANRMIEQADSALLDTKEHLIKLETELAKQIKETEKLNASLLNEIDKNTKAKQELEKLKAKFMKEQEKNTKLINSELTLNAKIEVAMSDKKEALSRLEDTQSSLAKTTAMLEAKQEILAEKDKRLNQLEEQLNNIQQTP